MATSWRVPYRRRPSPIRRATALRTPIIALEDRCVPATLTVGPDVNVTRLFGDQSEAAIAVNPTNPSHMAVIANDIQDGGSSFSRSTDGGLTWTTRVIANGGDSLAISGAGDGHVMYDKFGNLYAVFMDQVDPANLATRVLLSTDDGQSFTILGTPIIDQGLDYPKIATGPGMAAGTASVWISAETAQGIDMAEAQVTGLGKVGTFSTAVTLPGSFFGNFGGIAVGPNGQVLDSYNNPADGSEPTGISTNLDPDGAGPIPFGNAGLATTTNVGSFHSIPAQPNRAIDAGGYLAYDRSGGAHNGRVYLAYADTATVGSVDTNIFVRYSDDNGASWSPPIKVNDDTGTNSQFFPTIAVDQSTGNVAVGWYDARNSPGNNSVEYFVSASTDGGATFLPNVQVAKALTNGNAFYIGDPNELGDFYHLDFVNGVIHAVWADNSGDITGNPDPPSLDIATAAITLNGGGSNGNGTGKTTGTSFVGADAGEPPIVRLVDLATGATVFQTMAFSPTFTGGVRVARGDVNGDGVPDLIAAAGPGGGPQVKVFDGVTHKVIANFYALPAAFTGGVYVAAGDVNGDKNADIIVGAGPGGGPQVKVFSVANGSVLQNFYAFNVNFHGGVTVASGDVNDDGKADIVVGAGPGGGPQVKVFSGANGSVLLNYFAYPPGFTGGVYVAAGDLNGDGHADVITGTGPNGGNRVRAFSGVDGRPMLDFAVNSFTQTSVVQLGPLVRIAQGVRVAAEDVDGDGLADIILVPGAGISPVAQVRRGTNGALISSFAVLDPSLLGGVFVG
jgi:hypothetical protein